MKTKSLVLVLTGISLFSVAHAATVTKYSGAASVGSSLSDFSIAKFDSSLGTLTGVTVFVSTSQIQGSVGITNNAIIAASIEGYDSTFNIRQSPGTDLGYGSPKSDTIYDVVTTPAWSSVTLAASAGQETLTIGAGQSFSIASVDIASSFFGAYQSADGTGSVTFQAKSAQSLTISGASFSLDSSAAFVNTNIGVTYTYNVVPEPSAFALLGLGAMGLVARRRRSA